APHLSPAQEDALLGREAVTAGLRRCVLEFFAQRHERDAHAAVISSVLTEGQAAIQFQAGHRLVAGVLVGDAAGALVELSEIFFRPPIAAVPVSVKLRAL